MGIYIEEIQFPFGIDEAKRRINTWRETSGQRFKLVEKSDGWIHINHKTMHFIITPLPTSVKVEAWVGGVTKYSISKNAFVGAIARREGWKVYETLRNFILDGSLSTS